MDRRSTMAPMEELLRHAGWARRLASSLAGGRDAGDDLVQDTFTAAAVQGPGDDRSPRGWLRRVMLNQRSKRRLAERRRQAREAAVAAGAVVTAEHGVGPEDLLARLQVQRLLAEVVLSLPEPYRQTLLLRYYEERSAADIGRALGVPAGTVRWRLKQGLERARVELARRSGADGRGWLRVIAPLVGGARRRWRWPAALGWGLAGGLLAGAGALWLLGRTPRVDSTRRYSLAAIAVDRPAPAASPRPVVLAAAAPPASLAPAALADCRREVGGLRHQVAEAENEALSVLSPHALYRRGSPNPAAAARLAPELERVLRGSRPAAPAHTLECRTWACKLTVLETSEEMRRPDHWMGPLQRDPLIGFAQPMVRRYMFASAGRVRDPVADVPLNRQFVFFSLAASDGGQRAYGRPRAGKGYGRLPLISPPPSRAPATLASCRSQRAELRARLHAAERDLRAHARLDERFHQVPPDQGLTAEMTAELRRLGRTLAPAARPAAECRGDLCRLLGLQPRSEWRKALGQDRFFQQRLGMQAVGLADDWYVVLKSPEELATIRWLTGLLDRVAAPADLTACAAEHRDSAGRLRITLTFEGLESDAGSGAIDVQLGSDLGGTRLADCVAQLVRGGLAGARPPAGAVSTLNTSATTTVTFPIVPP